MTNDVLLRHYEADLEIATNLMEFAARATTTAASLLAQAQRAMLAATALGSGKAAG